MSELGEFAYVAHSDRLEDLAARIRGWLVHPAHAHRYGLASPHFDEIGPLAYG